MDVKSTVESYIDESDWRVKANANQNYNLSGLVNNNSGKVIANYWLDEVYPEEIGLAHREGDIHIHDLDNLSGYCFTGDTRISLLDGTEPTLEELYLSGRTEGLELYAYDIETQDIVPAVGYGLCVTRETNQLVEVTLDNGEKVKCTPDHPWMRRNGTYCEAQNLVPGDSLMPLYRSYSGQGKYRTLRHGEGDSRIKSYVHRWHMSHIIGRPLAQGEVVHHINKDKRDNRRSNLELMQDGDHKRLEIALTRTTGKWKKGNAERLRKYNRSAEKRAQVSGTASVRDRDEQGRFYNHKVVDVQPIETARAIPVYDLTVPKYHNFAISAGVFVHNCAGWSLRELLEEGFGGVAKNVSARPPKHFSSACGQIVNFIGVLQSEWAGAQAFSSFDTYMAPFVRLDNLSLEQVKQSLQEMIFSLNVPSRWGQSPFSNLTFDWTCPDDLRDQYPLIGGEVCEFSYGDLQPEMDVINRAFIEVIGTGDGDGRPFTFPIPTYNITRDFDWDSPNANLLFQMTGKYGLPYFQNFINSTMNPEDVRSMCCRLRLDKRELLKRGNGLFGSAEKTGSIGVVTINMARLGYLHKNNREELFDALERLVELAVGSLEIKRVFVQRQMDAGLYPFSQRYLGTLRNHFSTVGVNGINEMVRNFTNDTDDITSEFGHQFALDVLDVINDRLQQYQESTGNLYNLEATPAEGTTYRFAKEDKKRFPDILQAGTKSNPYYTNSSQLPVDFTNDPFEALQQQDELQCKYTGGTVLHLYTGESVTNAKQIIYRAFTKFNLPYLSITPTFSVCKSHGFISGEHFECPECHDLCEVWTRVMGYFRPVQSFNVGKVGEFEERTYTNANNM